MLNKKALAASVSAPPSPYVEDVFSTYLYTGNGTSQTITNGIDLAGEGGLVWIKQRDSTLSHVLTDSERGVDKAVFSNLSNAQQTSQTYITSFNSNGFSVGGLNATNADTIKFASWTFRKAPKFFDVVTYTGNGSNRTIAHNLGSVPGMIIVKRTDTTGDWQVYHRSLANTEYLVLNTSAAKATGTTRWNSTTPTSTEFSLGTDATVNANTGTYVAYLFAHDAGGFGDAGTDNIISCGSYSGNGSTTAPPDINLGYEPQYLLIKRTDSTGDWQVGDVMRGLPNIAFDSSTGAAILFPSYSNAESTTSMAIPTSTGFRPNRTNLNEGGATYIYMAIRRPMKKPTSGTEVFSPSLGATATPAFTSSFPVDLAITSYRSGGGGNHYFVDRLRGQRSLESPSTGAEGATSSLWKLDQQTGFSQSSGGWDTTHVAQLFKRAPSFFDVVCYTGTGSATTVTHNLGTVPELMIVKRRDSTGGWQVYSAELAANGLLVLNSDAAATTGTVQFNATRPTASVFSVGTSSNTNASGGTYVAYLFDSVAGVSKIGTYTGNGTNQTINCGFSAGARFVLIKRTDSTGDWTVFDTARGIVSGDDPSLALNTTAAEQSADSLDPANSGFIVNQEASENLNVNAATYIYLAIA